MRIVTWNCRVGAFRRKAGLVAALRHDIALIQEIEPLEQELFLDGPCQPTFRHRFGTTGKRGIGVLSYTETRLRCIEGADELAGFCRYEAAHSSLHFNVAAVWTFETRLRATRYRQAHDGLARFHSWVVERPTIVAGDFNANASLAGTVFGDFHQLAASSGLISAYHTFFGEPFGAETRFTHFHKGNANSPFHIDYCFVPLSWQAHITNVEVPDFATWRYSSDHVPLIVDIDTGFLDGTAA